MKTITIRLPENLLADIENESRLRQISKSEVVRERLELNARRSDQPGSLKAISDLIGSVDGLPADLSVRKKAYLKATSYR
jgi:Arc/MetJ-type ribon-helix-helix transcriptional regulator